MAIDDDETAEKGISGGAHAGDSGRDRAPGGDQVAPGGDGEGDQLDLLAGSLEIDDTDTLAVAAELVARPRRERGRPPGATNKRNTQMFDYLERLGHRDPAMTLSMIQSADPLQLAKALGADSFKGRMAVLSLQRAAAADLMPYKYAKKPQALELPTDAKRPLMVIGEMTVIGNQQNNAMSVGDPRPKKANEINARAVRHAEDESHDDRQAIDGAGENGGEAPD